MMRGDIKLLSGNVSKYLKEEIARFLDIRPTELEVSRFNDGEIKVQIKENIRGHDVFIIQSTIPPADNLMELLLLIDAAKRASAARITAVIPYFGYARQDRKDQPRVPISAKLVANLIERAGANRVLTMDLHSEQIQGFFDVPVDNIFPTPVFRRYITQLSPETHIVVSPDVGGVKRARAVAKRLGNLQLALIDKRRPQPNVAEVVHIIGEVEGKRVVLVDDIIDTGNTLAKAAVALREKGAVDICAIATHGVFSKGAKSIIDDSPIERVWVTNTLPRGDNWPEKAVSLSIGELLADVILRIHEERSVSQVFI